MHYYLVAILKTRAPLLTYASVVTLKEFDIVNITLYQKKRVAIIIKEVEKPKFICKELNPTTQYFNSLQKQLAKFIAQYYCTSYGESFGIFMPMEKSYNLVANNSLSLSPVLNPLNSDQQKAFDFCLNKNFSLLFGDTGSGKTEIFFHLITHILKQNQSILLLMPEISLTPQMEKRLKNAFGDIFVLWHSKLTAKKRKENLEKIKNYQAKIIAGARSALFLPLQNLGLIIVDEEHDDAYKSQSNPRYNAKDLCIFLSKKSSIKVLLASATPSPTSYLIAKEKHCIFRLKGRFFQTKKQFIFDRSSKIPSFTLLKYLTQNLEKKEQSLVFVPTRANFKTLLCQSCGESITCKYCSVAMSLHYSKNAMVCHYCGFNMPIPQICPKCNYQNFISQRIGTAQLKIELQSLLPEARIAILDKDHTTTNAKMNSLFKALKNQEIDILIGTQMIAKGHDYPLVTLSVVLELDYILKSPDFRCNEKAFNLLYQVAGRSGRKENGKVLIQSLNTIFLEQFLGDYEDFLRYELQNRKGLYPPYKKLILLHFQHKDLSCAIQNMQEVLNLLIQNSREDFEIIGADQSNIQKINNIYRYHVLLRVHRQVSTLKLIHHIKTIKDFDIDVDPLDFS